MVKNLLLLLQKFPHIILAALGFCLGVFIRFLEIYTPHPIHLVIYNLLTLILVINGMILGFIIRKLFKNVYMDTLTGLGNKGMFYARLEVEMNQAKKSELCLAMLDLDHFKQINDTYGHLAGDSVLKKLSAILKKNIRKTDISIRWGGEEFAIIMPDTDIYGASRLLERIRVIIESYDFGPEVNSSQITVSTGIVSYTELAKMMKNNNDEMNALDLFVNLADKALFKAKIPRNTVVTWNEEYIA